MTNVYKLIKINKETKEITIIIDNEYLPLARLKAREINKEKFDVKIINNLTNKEIELKEKNKRTNTVDYKHHYRVYRNNYIKMF